jgi:hypothetical protein
MKIKPRTPVPAPAAFASLSFEIVIGRPTIPAVALPTSDRKWLSQEKAPKWQTRRAHCRSLKRMSFPTLEKGNLSVGKS